MAPISWPGAPNWQGIGQVLLHADSQRDGADAFEPCDGRGVKALLDGFIPDPDARERFQLRVAAPPRVVLAVAREYDMQSHPLVHAIFALRELVKGSRRVPREPRGLVEEMRAIGWGVLLDDPDRAFVAGAACQPWLADVRFQPLTASTFRDHDEPGQVKIAWTLEATSIGGATLLATETRAVATDAAARAQFLRYWRWARFGIIPIRWLLLPAVRRRAEARWRSRSATA